MYSRFSSALLYIYRLQTFVGFQNDPDKVSNMPKDGTVHELTSNVSSSSFMVCVDTQCVALISSQM